MTDSLREQLQEFLGTAYVIERELEVDGLTRVFVAEETAPGRRVVLKLLPRALSDSESVERFKREVAVASRLVHPHIVPLLSADEMYGLPFVTMPYVEGESLRAIVKESVLPIADSLRLLREIASALAYAHEQGVVHRDLKLKRVLVVDGVAMVTDFGVAKAMSSSAGADAGGAAASPGESGASLEQPIVDPVADQRADIAAFGALAYELLTGQRPFAGRKPQGMLAVHMGAAPEPVQNRRPGVPDSLAAVVMWCLAKRVSDRPQSAADIVTVLDEVATATEAGGGESPISRRISMAADPEVASPVSPRQKRITALLTAVAVLLVLAGAVVGLRALRRRSSLLDAPSSRPMAVLEIVNQTGDSTEWYFAYAMTDELTDVLSHTPGVKVATRNAAASVDVRKQVDPRSVGARLDVGSILEGHVVKDVTKRRLTMQLSETDKGTSLWARTFDVDEKTAFRVQDSIAYYVTIALGLTPPSGGRRSYTQSRTENAQAHDLVMRGKFQLLLGSEAALKQAASLFDRAAKLDPNYTEAWVGVANAWQRLVDEFMPAREALPSMRAAVQRAMALDSLDPDALAAQGQLQFWYDRNLRAAEKSFVRALQIDSTTDRAAINYAFLLWTMQRNDSAVEVMHRLQATDPYSRLLARYGVTILARTGRLDEADQLCDRLDAAHTGFCKFDIFNLMGKYQEALAVCRKLEPAPSVCAASLLAQVGQKEEALREAARAMEKFKGKYISPMSLAFMWARAGDPAQAINWLEVGERDNMPDLTYLAVDPLFASLRKEPRYQALIKRVAPH